MNSETTILIRITRSLTNRRRSKHIAQVIHEPFEATRAARRYYQPTYARKTSKLKLKQARAATSSNIYCPVLY